MAERLPNPAALIPKSPISSSVITAGATRWKNPMRYNRAPSPQTSQETRTGGVAIGVIYVIVSFPFQRGLLLGHEL